MEEIEVKFLGIDVLETTKKLKSLSALKIFKKLYRRRVFDYPDFRLDKKGAWLRLRDEGDQIMLTYKQRLGIVDMDGKSNDAGMEEVEVKVSDFDKTAHLLNLLGFKEKHYRENYRTRFTLAGKAGEIEFDIDETPMIPPYLEIEAKSWGDIDWAIKKLGLDPGQKKIFSTKQIYTHYGIDESKYSVITFDKQVKK